jgi:hypothetical protein
MFSENANGEDIKLPQGVLKVCPGLSPSRALMESTDSSLTIFGYITPAVYFLKRS